MEELKPYFPPLTRNSRYPWLNNFYTELLLIYKDYDISDQEMADLLLDRDFAKFVWGRTTVYEDAANLFVTSRNITWSGDPKNPGLKLVVLETQPAVLDKDLPAPVAPNMFLRLKSLVTRLRNHPKMTETVSRKLGILIKGGKDVVVAEFVPKLSATVVDGQVVLDCAKGDFAGYIVSVDVTGKNNFVKLGISVGRFFTDETPLPKDAVSQLRFYKVQMLDSTNKPVGLESAIVQMTATK